MPRGHHNDPARFVRIDPSSQTVLASDVEKLADASRRYQQRLLAYFGKKMQMHDGHANASSPGCCAVVDVRAGVYQGLDRVDPRLRSLVPFERANARESPGPFPKCASAGGIEAARRVFPT